MNVVTVQPKCSEPKKPLTAKQVLDIYNVKVSPQQLGALRRKSRLNAGPPFRYTLHYPPPVLTPEEEAEALAQAEYEDAMGILCRGEDGDNDPDVTVLRAQNLEDAKAEAAHLWRTQPHENAVGYSVCSRDWSSKHVHYVDDHPLSRFYSDDNVVALNNVR